MIELLRYLYLLSAFCYPVPAETRDSFINLKEVFSKTNNGWLLTVINFSRYIGTIMVEMITMEACVKSVWDGRCFGGKIGSIGGLILDVSATDLD